MNRKKPNVRATDRGVTTEGQSDREERSMAVENPAMVPAMSTMRGRVRAKVSNWSRLPKIFAPMTMQLSFSRVSTAAGMTMMFIMLTPNLAPVSLRCSRDQEQGNRQVRVHAAGPALLLRERIYHDEGCDLTEGG